MECKWAKVLTQHYMIVGKNWVAGSGCIWLKSYTSDGEICAQFSEIAPIEQVNKWNVRQVKDWLGY